MNSYYEKRAAARLKVESGAMALREDTQDNMVEEKSYHVMYYDSFPEYFTYMITCDLGGIDDDRQQTLWGFDVYDTETHSPYYRKPPDTYEYCLLPAEVEAWLDKYYGKSLDEDDYRYLISILENAYSSYGETFVHADYKKSTALKWLNYKVEHTRNAPLSMPLEDLGGQWNVPKSQFVELVYALVLSGALTPTRPGGIEGLVERLGAALGVKGSSKNINAAVNAIRHKRNNDRPSPLLDKMKDSYMKWWLKDDEVDN